MYSTSFEISNRIQQIMNDLELTQNQLAKLLHITQPAISKYLQGRMPPPAVLLQLSKLSGQTIEWFLTGEKNLTNMPKKLQEKSGSYLERKSLEEKLKLLPHDITEQIEKMVDSILQNLK